MADLKKGYEIEGNRIERMKRGTPCNFGTRPGCYQEPPQVRVLSFTIGFDEAQTFYKSHGYGIKPSKWHDLTVEVYI